MTDITVADAGNATHSREMSGGGVNLDADYLVSLGAQAIPALDLFTADDWRRVPLAVIARRNARAAAHLARMQDWRAWSLRDDQLARYLREK